MFRHSPKHWRYVARHRTVAAMPTARRTTYSEVLAHPEFRALLGSRTLSITATTLRMLAVSVLVLETTGSPLLAGLAFGIGFLPQVLGGATLLSLADRLRARQALVLGALAESAAAAVIALVPLPTWAVLALLAGVAVWTPVFSAAASALVPSLLTGDHYVLGRSLLTLVSSGSQIAGLGLGGVVLALLAPRDLLLVAAGLHLMTAVVSRLRLADRPPRSDGRAGAAVRATWQGNRALLGDPVVRGQLLVQTLPPTIVTGAEALVVSYVAQVGLPSGATGALLACFPVGMGLGDVVVGRFCAPAVRERLSGPILLLMGLPLVALVLTPPVAVVALLLTVAGSGFSYELGVQRRFLAALPESLRGQGFGLLGTVLMFGQGIGPVVFGALGSALSPSTAMALSGAAVVVTAVALLPHVRAPVGHGVPATGKAGAERGAEA